MSSTIRATVISIFQMVKGRVLNQTHTSQLSISIKALASLPKPIHRSQVLRSMEILDEVKVEQIDG